MRVLEESLSEMRRLFKDVDFDCCIMITYNSEKHEVRNGWHFDKHPSEWSSKELSSMAQQITSACAEAMKYDVNVGREVTRKIQPVPLGKTVKTLPQKEKIFGFGLGLVDGRRPLFISGYKSDPFL